MVRMFLRKRVEDFESWKPRYDDFQEHREALGVRAHAVFNGVEDPNEVTIWHDFDDLAAAKAFVDSDLLRDAIATSGQTGTSDIWYVHRELP
jgi:heme-degrading monooxygenase HmoA